MLKSLMLFLQQVLHEMGTWCCASTIRDWKTIADRVEHEGISFLTITLPIFGKDFLRGLDQGYVDHTMFPSFSKGRGGTPLFLGGFLDLVFDRGTGRLLDSPSTDAIQSVLQITLLAEKMYIDCSPKRVRKALKKYIECEREMDELVIEDSLLKEFSSLANRTFGNMFYAVDRKVRNGELIPRHGPGSTADKLLGNKKYNQKVWHWRLEEFYPSVDFLVPNSRFYEILETVHFSEPGAERPVKVITVPKTLKTPRIIAVEPTAMQYAQQALMAAIEESIEEDYFSKMLISYSSQIPNQEMALKGSRDGSLATLDLSEASDRVSNQLILAMLQKYPYFSGAAQAARSTTADVRGYGVLPLSKYASMGSALCFPFESMVFMIITLLGIQDELNRQLTHKDIKSFMGQVRTYGDDIIVPSRYARSVVAKLQTFGLVVNVNKSFWTGKFRESCGKWYYAGEEVTPVRLRQYLPSQRRHAQEIISTISLRNQLYERGLWSTVRYLDSSLERLIPFPAVLDTSPILGKRSFLGYQTQGWDPLYQRPLVRGVAISAKLPSSMLDDYGALLKYFLKKGELPFADKRHLERAGRPRAVNIKLVKAVPY